MRIEDNQGREITDLDSWATIYDNSQQSHQWKEHRSAYSMAEFTMNRGGAESIHSRVVDILGEAVQFDKAIPEQEIRFDEYGRGRVHDLAIYGNTDSGKSVFVGVEAKVDEPFGQNYVRDAYLVAKARQIAGESTNAPQRIEKLLALHFDKPKVSMFDVRYQLLYATTGTLAAGADISVLYVIVFKTPLYDEKVGADNYRDYIQFMTEANAMPLKLPNKETVAHQLELGGKKLACLHEYFEL